MTRFNHTLILERSDLDLPIILKKIIVWLKRVVWKMWFFIQTVLSFVLSCWNVTVKDFRKYEKLEYKNKLKLDIDFLNNCKQLGVYPKFLIFKLPNVSDKEDALSIRKRLLLSAISKRNKELRHLSKELSLSENFLFTQLSTIDFYILTKFIRLYNKKSLQKLLYIK